jgi:hypothetical protein
MRAPSQNYFSAIYSVARQNNMFQQPFSFYDGYSGLSEVLEKNYLYVNKMNYYDEFLKRSLIDPSQVNTTIDPSIGTMLPRNGVVFQTGTAIYDNLIYTSSVQDMVFKHFLNYCPEGYDDVCEVILSATSSGVFSTSGIATSSPNGAINPESLMAQPSFKVGSSSHKRARDYIQMITSPFPRSLVPFKPDPYTPGLYVADTSNIAQIAKNLSSQSRRGLSQFVLNEIKNRRVQSIDPDQSSASSTRGGTLSSFEFIHNLAMNRMQTSNGWLAEINIASPEALQRELVLIQASQLMMQYQAFKQNENIEALLATLVAQNEDLQDAFALAVSPDTSKIQESMGAIG